MVGKPQKAQHSMGYAAVEKNSFYFVDDKRIVGRDHEWIHDALVVMVYILFRMGLESNLEKTKEMVCTPRFI